MFNYSQQPSDISQRVYFSVPTIDGFNHELLLNTLGNGSRYIISNAASTRLHIMQMSWSLIKRDQHNWAYAARRIFAVYQSFQRMAVYCSPSQSIDKRVFSLSPQFVGPSEEVAPIVLSLFLTKLNYQIFMLYNIFFNYVGHCFFFIFFFGSLPFDPLQQKLTMWTQTMLNYENNLLV